MTYRLDTLFAVAIILTALSETSAGETPLRWRFVDEKTINAEIVQKRRTQFTLGADDVDSRVESTVFAFWSCSPVDDRSAIVKFTTKRIVWKWVIKGREADAIVVDSSVSYDKDAQESGYAEQLSPLIGSSLSFELQADGRTSKWDLGEGSEVLIADPMLRQGGVLPKDLEQILRSLLPKFADATKQDGEQWSTRAESTVPPMRAVQSVDYTIESIDGEECSIKANGEIVLGNGDSSVRGALEGRVVYSESLGRILESSQTNRIRMPAGFSSNIATRVDSTLSLKLGPNIAGSRDEP